MKKSTVFFALALACGLTVLAGCGASNPKTATSANWDVTFNDDESWLHFKETATYKLSFSGGANSTYAVEYDADSAVYTTCFYAEKFDWQTDTLDGYKSNEPKEEFVYVYETRLTISGKYIYKSNGEEMQFTDTVETLCKFRKAGENLGPVYSRQRVHNMTPNVWEANSLSSAYAEVDCEYETFYDLGSNRATVITTDFSKEGNPKTTKGAGDLRASAKSLFDRCSLGTVMRALTKGTSHNFNLFVPQNVGLIECNASCSGLRLLDAERDADIIKALDESEPEDYIFVGKDEEGKPAYGYSEVRVGVAAELSGPAYAYWFAHVNNADINPSKGVMLKAETPLSFNLGTLTYTLSSLKKELNLKEELK